MYLGSPEFRDGIIVETVEHGLQSLGHHYQTLQSFLQVFQGGMDDS